MQSQMFVFVGKRNDNSITDLDALVRRLNLRFQSIEPPFHFDLDKELISTRIDDVIFYISFLNDKSEIDEWIQMARDFELTIDMSTLTKETLLTRYGKLKDLSPDLYDSFHYFVAEGIFTEMNELVNTTIYSFQ
jgi:hypothetical protein